MKHCHIDFVSHPEAEHLADIVGTVQGSNALLVGESDGFAESGGMIEFTLEQGRVRFTINNDAALRAGLKFSAKLLAWPRSNTTENIRTEAEMRPREIAPTVSPGKS